MDLQPNTSRNQTDSLKIYSTHQQHRLYFSLNPNRGIWATNSIARSNSNGSCAMAYKSILKSRNRLVYDHGFHRMYWNCVKPSAKKDVYYVSVQETPRYCRILIAHGEGVAFLLIVLIH